MLLTEGDLFMFGQKKLNYLEFFIDILIFVLFVFRSILQLLEKK